MTLRLHRLTQPGGGPGRRAAALARFLCTPVYFGRSPARVPRSALVFFPLSASRLCCGLAGIVTFGRMASESADPDLDAIGRQVAELERHSFERCMQDGAEPAECYLGGDAHIRDLLASAGGLKHLSRFAVLFENRDMQRQLQQTADRLAERVKQEDRLLSDQMGLLDVDTVRVLAARIDRLKDIAWCLSSEVIDNLAKVRRLAGADGADGAWSPQRIRIYKNINAVLNSIDRLEVRGRDSAGISLMFILDKAEFERFEQALQADGRLDELRSRSRREVLINGDIHVQAFCSPEDGDRVTVTFTYKVAAEIGRLGDNIRFLRRQIQNDGIFHRLAACPHRFHTIASHTRWASVGAITEANCHPVDNAVIGTPDGGGGIIHVCLNGDIDNYMQLRAELEAEGLRLHDDITTDTKIIPLQIEKYIRRGEAVEEAFRLAVNDFEGSHAISMHTDLAPGKLFLAQKGSGQTIFVGLAEDHYMPTSEVYGFVEETDRFLKLDGEKIVPGRRGDTQGQIVVLDQHSAGGVEGIRGMYYDGTALKLGPEAVKSTAITSRDIDRQDFPHYFLKEISESPQSVEKTLQNRWKIHRQNGRYYRIALDDSVVPAKIRRALDGRADGSGIRRIFFVGQGTAGIAAQVCADIMQHYLDDPGIQVRALKASELSGFGLQDLDGVHGMEDALVIAISQSGTTTDTNRTIDMVRERGAHTLAIVNRRDSDITFKVDGVMYTSSGRDIEMSVASTKAFYSQIVAGALLGLFLAEHRGRRDGEFVTAEIKNLLALPDQMRSVLEMREAIAASARKLATGRTYWAAVGSGPNKSAADEIRIKLSELCYKTISTDFVEDKKHIDLSSEPLIIVCAAGTRSTVIGDIVKDTAIFKAHKATPVVIADQGERRFDPYAESVFHVPAVAEHLAPILNTLVGHLWGYYAALAINEGSSILFRFQQDLKHTLEAFTARSMDLYEIILEKTFKEKVAAFYGAFRRNKIEKRFPTIMGIEAASDLTLLLKYLAGRLPASDFEVDFGMKGTPSNMLNCLFRCLGECINAMARPVDAIKHQAKTVTVGTSRISEKLAGLLFDILEHYGFTPAQVTPGNIHVLKNLQEIVADVKGAIRYRISDLTLLGEPTEDSRIELERKDGVLAAIPSRVEADTSLKGTKKIIVRQGNVYIGKGRKDDRSILVIPIISTHPETPNLIEHLLLLNIAFRENVPLPVKIKALGGKYEHIKNIVQENSVPWLDEHLQMVAMDELFGRSAEKIGEYIVARLQKPQAKTLRPAAGD